MKTKYLIMLSEIIDKMGISNELKSLEINTGDEEADNEEVGKELLALIITNMHKCKKEIYTFIAAFKGYLPKESDYDCSLENKESGNINQSQQELDLEYNKALNEALLKAEEEDIIPIFKEILKIDGIKSFLA